MRRHNSWNLPINVGKEILYMGFLTLFAYQTWKLTVILFPNDVWFMRFITMLSFDVMSGIWAFVDMFFMFSSRGAKVLVRVTAFATFVLSFLASVVDFYIEFIVRYHGVITTFWYLSGVWISLATLTLNLITVMFFRHLEHEATHPHKDNIDQAERIRDGREMRAQGWRKRGNYQRVSAPRGRGANSRTVKW